MGPKFEQLEPRLLLTTVTWDGDAGDMLWASAANWSDDTLPGPEDQVIINLASGETVIHAAGDTVIDSLVCTGSLMLTGGRLSLGGVSVQGSLQVDGVLTLDGGALADANILAGAGGSAMEVTSHVDSSLANITSAIGLDLADSGDRLVLAGDLTLNSVAVTLGPNAVLTAMQTLTLGGTGSVTFNGPAATPSSIAIADGAELTLGAGITVTASQGRIDNVGPGAGVLVNQGVLRGFSYTINADLANEGLVDFFYSSAGSSSYINGAFTNAATGTLRVRAYTHISSSYRYVTLTTASGLSNYGLIELTDTYGGYNYGTYVTLNVGGTLVNESTGQIVVTSAIGSVGSRVLNAEIDNRGTITIDRPVRIETSDVNHVNSGTMAFNAAGSSFRNFATLTNSATGSITAAAGLTINDFTTLTNDGLIDIDGGAFTTQNFTDMTNAGTVTVDGGYWNLSSYSTLLNTGVIRMADDQRFSVTGGVVTHAGTELSGYQLYFTSNAELALPNDWTNVDSLLYLYAGSRMTGAGTVTNQRNIHAYNATIETDLVNEGLVDFLYSSAGSTSYINGAFTNAATGTLRVRAYTHISSSYRYVTLTTASGFSNYGLIELMDTYGGYNYGTYVTLNVGGTLVNESTGQIVVTSAIGSVGSRVLNAEIDNRGTMTIDRPVRIETSDVNHVNSGTMAFNASGSSFRNFATLTNTATGSITAAAGLTINYFTTLTNDGLIDIDGGAFATHNFTDMTNAGTVTVDGGYWNLSSYSTLLNTGIIRLADDQRFSVTGGVVTHAGTELSGYQLMFSSSAELALTNDWTLEGSLLYLYSNSRMTGSGTVTNRSEIHGYNFTIDADLVNEGLLDFHYNDANSINYINGSFVNAATGTLRIRALTYYGYSDEYATLTVASGFSNYGLIELTDTYNSYGSATYVTLNVGGTLVNESTGQIVVTSAIGSVAGRVLNAEIDNRGTMTIDRPVRIETSGVNHVNSGTMAFNAAGSSFRNFATLTNTATGSITAAAGLTINYFTTLTNDGLIDIDGGAFNTHSFTDMTNAGTVTVDGGYWNLSSYSTLLNTGIIRMADDQRFSVTGGVVTHAGTELSGYQLYFTSNAELALPNDWTNVDSLLYLYAGSRMTGAGTVTNQRNIHAYNATIETDLVNEGLVDFHYNIANSVNYINGSFINAATGTLRIRALTYYSAIRTGMRR